MRIVISEFMSLDGVCQAPGGPEEDTDGGFRHGGWSMPFFDPEVMGAAIGEGFARTEALLFGRRTWAGMAKAWPERAGDAAWPEALRLTLDFAQGGARRLTVDVPPAWQDRWPPR